MLSARSVPLEKAKRAAEAQSQEACVVQRVSRTILGGAKGYLRLRVGFLEKDFDSVGKELSSNLKPTRE